MIGVVTTKVWYDKNQMLKEFLDDEAIRNRLGSVIQEFYYKLWQEGSDETWDIFWRRALNRKVHTCFTLRVSERLLTLKHYLYNVAHVDVDYLRPVSIIGKETMKSVLTEAGIYLAVRNDIVYNLMSKGLYMGEARKQANGFLDCNVPYVLSQMSPAVWRNNYGLVLLGLG